MLSPQAASEAALRVATPGAVRDMVKRSWVFVVVGMVALASLAAPAQDDKNGVVTINGGRNVLSLRPPSKPVIPAAAPPAGLVTIYSNLSFGDHVYNANAGAGIVGPDEGMPRPQWAASAFTPTADHLVQAIQVGVGYVQGTDEVIVSLQENAKGGFPGMPLVWWKFSNLPKFGSCCVLQTGKFRKGIPIKANTQYWVAVRTTPQGTDTFAAWNDNYKGLQGHWANNLGTGWINEGIQVLGAFGVYGQ